MDEHPLSPNLGGASGGGDFPPINYLEWYLPRLQKGVVHDLSQSGLSYPWGGELKNDGGMLDEFTDVFSEIQFDPRIWVAQREGVEPSQVAGGHGVSQCLLFALLAVMNNEKPRRVAVEIPSYAPVSQFARALGCEVVPFTRGPLDPTDCGPWKICRSELEGIIDEVCAVVTTPLQNPTGWMMDIEDQKWLSNICQKAGIGIVSDEVYLDSTKGTEYYRPMHTFGHHCVSVNSLTKCYGLGTLRIGWIIGSKEMADNAVRAMHSLQGSLAMPSLHIAKLAWPHLDSPLEYIKQRRIENIPLLQEVLSKNGIKWNPPPTGIFGCFALPEGIDSQWFVEEVCSKHDLLAVPGLMFSSELSNIVRVAWGSNLSLFSPAMEALDHCLKELKC
tara:strand:- start:210 stop:1373 length:1164 start_codon:yes stop_codon:yes gene_type:complete